jgi:hypothetical protein
MYKVTLIRFRRFRRFVLVAGVVAGAVVPAAGASGGPTAQGLKADGQRMQGIAQAYKQLESGPTELGLKADGLRLQEMAKAYQQQSAVPDAFERYVNSHSQASPDVLERYAAAHPYGAGLGVQAATSGDRIVDDYFRDAPSVATQSGDRIVDDYFRDAPSTPAAVPTDGGFNWDDWAIGIGSGIGLVLLVGTGLVTGRQVRQHLRTA